MAVCNVKNLRLDPRNPRLPERVDEWPQDEMFAYIYRVGVLDELVDSYMDNGFFPHEPLIVLPADAQGDRVVVEGNRRLAALMLALELDVAEGRQPVNEVNPDVKASLQEVPIYEVPDRDTVRDFLGFRHISGLRPWKPEAKARYIAREVELEVKAGSDHPFRTVARRLGSNTQGVRNSYVALTLLRGARESCNADVTHVMSERFGVWLRCMNSTHIKSFFGYGKARTYAGVHEQIVGIDCEKLSTVIQDLTPQGDHRKALLSDSRDVTGYGLVLADENARTLLRKYRDLQIAIQVVKAAKFPDRVDELRNRSDALRDEIASSIETAEEPLVTATAAFLRSAQLLNGVVVSLGGSND